MRAYTPQVQDTVGRVGGTSFIQLGMRSSRIYSWLQISDCSAWFICALWPAISQDNRKVNPMKTIAEINKAIESIARSGAKLDILIQDTGVSVLEHFAEHKDTGVVNRLYIALPKGARKQAMASWLLAYGALSPNTNKESKAEQPFIFDREKRTDALAAAQDKWYDHKPDKAPDQVFDLQKAIRQVLAKAAKGTTTATTEQLKALAMAVGIPESDVPSMVNHVDAPEAAM